MSDNQTKSSGESSLGSVRSYTIGFALSLALTSIAFLLTHKHLRTGHVMPSDTFMLWALSFLAITQLFVQLIFFLHLDRESKPRWNNTVLAFAAIVVIILVGGSIWIMTNLNYHHGPHSVTHTGHVLTTPRQTTQYIIQDEGIHQ
jgi:cytochrome o ubiquinol oxidase operon protein cyoD